MRTFLTSTVAFIALTAPGFAADVAASSAVSAATVYPEGAMVTRTAQFSAPAGDNRIIIDDLPFDFDPASLRVAGSGTASFQIISVDHRVHRLPPAPDADNPDRIRIEAEIEGLEAQIRALDFEKHGYFGEIQVADTRQKMVEALMAREPQKLVDDVEYQRAGVETWAQSIAVLAQETGVAANARAEAQRKIGEVDRRAEDIHEALIRKQQELAATQLPQQPRSVATVELNAADAVSGTLDVSYRVWAAGWQPVYDLRLDQGSTATLGVERHARVFQDTGEDWDDVALTLSTARPSQRMDAPDLPAQMAILVNAEEERSRDYSKSIPNAEPMVGLSLGQAALLEDALQESEEAPEFDANMMNAEIAALGQTIVYRLSGAADVAGDGTVRQLGIDSGTSDVAVLARSTPELDAHAYLYAALTNEFGSPILPGSASVFRDGTFVGEIRMPMIAVGQETALPFGVLDGIEISRHVLEKEDGDYGIIGTTNRRIERFELSAKSLLPYPIALTIYDRAPVTEDEDLRVDVFSQPAVSEENVDGKRGVRAWTFELSPGTTQKVEFGYDIRWPGDQSLIVE